MGVWVVAGLGPGTERTSVRGCIKVGNCNFFSSIFTVLGAPLLGVTVSVFCPFFI